MKQKMEKIQVLNDGADEEDFNELLQILRSFGELEQQLAHKEEWVNYWRNKYKECLEELKKNTTSKIKKIPTEQNKHLPCVTNKAYEITLFLMFNREFMNDVYRTFSIISRGL